MKFVTVGPLPLSALPGELGKVRRTFKEEVRLGLAYFPIDADHAELVRTWREFSDAPLVGASTAGIAFTQRGWSTTGITLGIFGGQDVGIARVERPRVSAVRKMSDAIRKACAAQPLANALLVLADPFSCNGEDILAALRSALPIRVRAFGATAGDDDRFVASKILHDEHLVSDGAIFVAMAFPKRVAIDVRHGFEIVEGARDMVVTRVAEARLIELDGRPAEDAYAEELRRLGLLPVDPPLSQDLARYSLGLKTPFGEGISIRSPLKILPHGELQMSSALVQGSKVSVVTTTREKMLAAANWLRERIESQVPDMTGALVFECGGRRARLKADFQAELALLRGNSATPMLGFTGYGEIAKFGGNVQGFHNITAVMVGW